jgi:hypothetical protein
VSNVYQTQHDAGCTNDARQNPQLRLAAQWHINNIVTNRNLNGDNGSDASATQDRGTAAGFRGVVAETVAINPSLAITASKYSTPGATTPLTWRS